MTIWQTFSKRQNLLAKAGQQDVYQYDDLPEPFRMQVVHIWNSALGQYFEPQGYFARTAPSPSNGYWRAIHNQMARELGLPFLGRYASSDPKEGCIYFLLNANTFGALDIIEMSFRVIDKGIRDLAQYSAEGAGIDEDPDSAIEELNHRFREHGLGYQYMGGILVRLDSQLLHSEVVAPALSLLNASGFAGPAAEFIKAFDHYRHGRFESAIGEALKSFESTLKAICDARRWAYPAKATAKPLIDTVMQNGLIPAELESHFSGLRSALESGLPTISNPVRHGGGAVPKMIPPHLAAYALHLTASNIVFLVEAHKSLK
jgi:hypothetical protein